MIRAFDAALAAGVIITATGGWSYLQFWRNGSSSHEKYKMGETMGEASSPEEAELFNAAATGDCIHIRRAALEGVSLDCKDMRFMRTPLAVAAANDQQSAITTLHEHGADIHCRDRHGITPLELAAWKGHSGVVSQLLSLGANPEVITSLVCSSTV